MSTPMYDMPEHFPIGVNSDGEGPVDDSSDEFAELNCWCKFRQPWPCPDTAEGDHP